MSRVTSLGEAFVGTKRYINLTVKIIKQVRAKQFLVADATGYRKIEVCGVVPHKHKKNLCEQNYVKIESALVDHTNRKIFLDMRTSIFNIREFPVVTIPHQAWQEVSSLDDYKPLKDFIANL